MKINFKTRGEARKYCWSRQIPLKAISKRDTGGLPWVVETEEVVFEVGKKYKLVDPKGFSTTSLGTPNAANTIQANQIEKHAPDGIVIREIEMGNAFIQAVPGLSFTKLKCNESKYFVEVTAESTAPADKPKKVAKKSDPKKWIAGRSYRLVDVHGFSSRLSANKTMVSRLDLSNKPLYIETVSSNGAARLSPSDIITLKNVNGILFKEERKYFEEVEEVAPADDSLDSELDNGTNLKPVETALVDSHNARGIKGTPTAISSVDIAKQEFDKKTAQLEAAVADAQAKHNTAADLAIEKFKVAVSTESSLVANLNALVAHLKNA
ncbi:hypothetical protein PHYNN_47 [Pantoea phage Phynn]|nr:hypothetical protein PHYNN_47 [Pantoea phage Phynn]